MRKRLVGWGLAGLAVTLLVLAISVVAAGVLSACGSTEGGASGTRPSAEALAAALTQPGGSSDGGADLGGARSSNGGNVTIQVSWENAGDPGPVTFSVAMDTHSVELDGYDLGRLAVLRNDKGQEVKPDRWDAPPGGHHRSGLLVFPEEDGSGKPLVGIGVGVLELVIRDVAGVKERVLRWEMS